MYEGSCQRKVNVKAKKPNLLKKNNFAFRCQPSSIRLMDNEQFKFGQALKTNESGFFGLIMDGIKKFYVTKIKRFNVDRMCVMTLLFEGNQKDVEAHEKKIYDIGKKYGGVPAGEKNGERGYMLTFVIAYIRV